MDFDLKRGKPSTQDGECVAVGVFGKDELCAAAQDLDKASGGTVGAILERGDLNPEPGQTLTLYNLSGVDAERVMLVSCGPEEKFNDTTWRKAVAGSAGALQAGGTTRAVSYLPDLTVGDRDPAWKLRQAVVATSDALYRFDRMKGEPNLPENPLEQMTFALTSARVPASAERGLREGQAIATGMELARDLGNLPGNVCTPEFLASQARKIKKGKAKLRASVLDEPEMEKLGMGALLSVSRGSKLPARLIALEYQGGDKKDAPVVLVGKGITFDTGGISLKPGAAMDEMKFDMCGAASVLGTMKACEQLGLPLNVVGIVTSAENMPGGNASKPGDIVTTMSGKTVEILNTDAEGRLVLCDALTWAGRYDPAVVIDIATLTGACIVALGHHPSGLLGNDDELAGDLIRSGERSGDRVWRLPLWDDYQDELKSNFADMANIGGRFAGTVTAACFLSRFTEDYTWAHLDIAGTAWNTGKEKGATGRPVPLLMQYLIDRAG
ncbi:MAG: leucyl aminopeptidase [Pseudomonadota bacterium]|nr:leucyl aminopeptidase [Pseudomonadota bacterium]